MLLRRPFFFTLSLALGAALAPGRSLAEILSTGVDTERVPAPLTVQSAPGNCPILWFRCGIDEGEINRLRALGYDLTIACETGLPPLSELMNYGVIVIVYTGAGLLADRQSDLQTFVENGGGLFIHQPNHVGQLDYVPTGFEVSITSPIWCPPDGYYAHIVDASHPVVAFCTDDDLSGALDGVGALGAGFHVLAVNPDCGWPAVAVGTKGLGRVVLDTGNGAPVSIDPGSDQYWRNVLAWLCSAGPVGVESNTSTSTWGIVKAGYR